MQCLLERESPILLASSFILCEEENVKYPVVNDVLDDSDVVMMITGTGGIILCQCGVNNRVSRCHLSYGVTQS